MIDLMNEFVLENTPRYPQRTVVQLHELIDNIREITSMTDQKESDQDKVELYLDHHDAIADVTRTFDERWERFVAECR